MSKDLCRSEQLVYCWFLVAFVSDGKLEAANLALDLAAKLIKARAPLC